MKLYGSLSDDYNINILLLQMPDAERDQFDEIYP